MASLLRAKGHEAFTPTLTGLGERVHLASPQIDLTTHIQDILGVIRYEELHEVILVGHSYGGMVITGVAEQIPDKLARLVYLDAMVPQDGQSDLDVLGPALAAQFEARARSHGDGWRLPSPPDASPKITAHPLKSLTQPLSVKNPVAARIPRDLYHLHTIQFGLREEGSSTSTKGRLALSYTRNRTHGDGDSATGISSSLCAPT